MKRTATVIDGQPTWHYESDGHVVITGPITGAVTTGDGTVYDVTQSVIEVEPSHAGEVAHLIGLRYEDEGHPRHDDDEPYLHTCTSHCGDVARDITDPTQALALVGAQQRTDAIPDGDERALFAEAHGTGDGGLSMALASSSAVVAALNGLDGTGTVNVIPDVSLHTASPSTTGANENANAGSYARLPCSWNAGSGTTKTNSTALTFTTAGSTPVTHFGAWSSATYGAGNYALGGALASSVTAATITIAAGALSLSGA